MSGDREFERVGPVKTLVVGPGHPWVVMEGAPRRHVAILRALTALGPVAYLGVGHDAEPPPGPPPACPAIVVRGLAWTPPRVGRAERVLGRVLARLGRRLGEERADDLRHRVVEEYQTGSFDLIWIISQDMFEYLRPALGEISAPKVVDLIDWPGEDSRSGAAPGSSLDQRIRRMRARRARAHRHRTALAVVDEVDAVLVSKKTPEVPATVHRIVNGYPLQEYAGPKPLTQPASLLFPGIFSHRPNAEAAAYLVESILPILRRNSSLAIETRLVGRNEASIRHLEHDHSVTVTGYVDRIEDELERADVCVVPLLSGTGTRVKILEAWSHQIPVVSTSVGADGLGVTDGRELLLADDATSFADAILRVLNDSTLRESLVREGHRHLSSHFSDAVVAAEVRSLLLELFPAAGRHSRGD